MNAIEVIIVEYPYSFLSITTFSLIIKDLPSNFQTVKLLGPQVAISLQLYGLKIKSKIGFEEVDRYT